MSDSGFTFQIGDKIIFKGYAEDTVGKKVFDPNEVVLVTECIEVDEDENGAYEKYKACKIGDTEVTEYIYFPDDADTIAEEPAEEKKPAKRKTATRKKPAAKNEAAKELEKIAEETEAPSEEPAEVEAEAEAPAEKPKRKATRKKPVAKKAEPEPEVEPEVEAEEPAPKKAPAKRKTAAKKTTTRKKPATKKTEEPAEETKELLPVAVGSGQMVITEAVQGILSHGSALESAAELLNTVDRTYFNLGGVLSYIEESGAYKENGHETFYAYCEDQLKVQRAKAQQIMRIYRTFSPLGLDETRLGEIGWTYARAMVNVVTKDNFEQLMDEAHEMKREEFEQHIKTTYVKEGKSDAGEKVAKVKFNFKLHADQGENAAKVIEEIGKELGTEDPNACFDYLVGHFMQHSDMEVSLEDDIKYVEEKHGIELQVVEAE